MKITAQRWFCYHDKEGIVPYSASFTRTECWRSFILMRTGSIYGNNDFAIKKAHLVKQGWKCAKFRLVKI
jgi:hypothetical protein